MVLSTLMRRPWLFLRKETIESAFPTSAARRCSFPVFIVSPLEIRQSTGDERAAARETERAKPHGVRASAA